MYIFSSKDDRIVLSLCVKIVEKRRLRIRQSSFVLRLQDDFALHAVKDKRTR